MTDLPAFSLTPSTDPRACVYTPMFQADLPRCGRTDAVIAIDSGCVHEHMDTTYVCTAHVKAVRAWLEESVLLYGQLDCYPCQQIDGHRCLRSYTIRELVVS